MKVEQECIEEVDEGELLVLRRALCKGPNLLTYLLTCVSRINASSSNVQQSVTLECETKNKNLVRLGVD